ncbi:MAG: methyltransferase domain-containing protein [Deltaproteobacteria bacterium]|nr:methyltransferase domain-containing protein [Deltaproteobacteria bacterium]
MQRILLEILACPACKGPLQLTSEIENAGEVESGCLDCTGCHQQYPIIRYVPRFVPAENYADNFGFQWNKFRQTQLDSHSKLPLSRERFFVSSALTPEDLTGKTVLDVGCGAGRFAEVALQCGAKLVALDYSSAVDACWLNLGPHPGLNVVQGDIYQLPFKPGSFEVTYCLGVLQHTTDVKMAFMALPAQLKPGGRLVVDIYRQALWHYFWPKYWLRPLTKCLAQDRLFALVQLMVKYFLPISLVIGRIPRLGHKLRYLVPVANHEPDWPLTPQQIREWAILDTYDMLAPVYDQPQSAATLLSWFMEAGLSNVEIFRHGVLIGRGVKGQ